MIHRFLTGMPSRFETAKGDPRFAAAVVDVDEQTGRARSIDRMLLTRRRHPRGSEPGYTLGVPARPEEQAPARRPRARPRRPADRALRRRPRPRGRGLEPGARAGADRPPARPGRRPAPRRRCWARPASARPSPCCARCSRTGQPHEEIVETTGGLFHVRRLPVRRGREVTHVVSWFEDITARREMEMRLIASDRLAFLGQLVSGRGPRDLEPARRHRRLRRGPRLARREGATAAPRARRGSSATSSATEVARCERIVRFLLDSSRAGARGPGRPRRDRRPRPAPARAAPRPRAPPRAGEPPDGAAAGPDRRRLAQAGGHGPGHERLARPCPPGARSPCAPSRQGRTLLLDVTDTGPAVRRGAARAPLRAVRHRRRPAGGRPRARHRPEPAPQPRGRSPLPAPEGRQRLPRRPPRRHRYTMNATGFRVLVAEDEQTFGLTVTRFLQKAGHEVKICTTGKAALKALDSAEWDVLLLDLKLPDADGVDILATRAQGAPRAADDHRHRLRQRAVGDRHHAPRRLRLPDQAPELRGARDAGGEGGREDAARAREPPAALPGAAEPLLRHPDPLARAAEGAAHDRDGGGGAHPGADRGRERRRQGAARAARAPPLAARRPRRSSTSTARRCRRRCSRASCSATSAGPSPAPATRSRASSRWPTAARSSSTRSGR